MSKLLTEVQSELGIFVGTTHSFSDTILHQANEEFNFVHFIRIATISDLLDVETDAAEQCCIVIVDEGQADELRQKYSAIRDRFRKANLALAYRQPELARSFLRHVPSHPCLGNIGVLPMKVGIELWLSFLQLLMRGERYILHELIDDTQSVEPKTDVADNTETAKLNGKSANLTERETQILSALSQGKQNKIIAEELALSEHTVKLHIHHVISKLGVSNRTEAAIWFLSESQ